MINISTWIQRFLKSLDANFGERVWFVGLQGSYGRGEATEISDIDVVVILDELFASDIQTYNLMLDMRISQISAPRKQFNTAFPNESASLIINNVFQ